MEDVSILRKYMLRTSKYSGIVLALVAFVISFEIIANMGDVSLWQKVFVVVIFIGIGLSAGVLLGALAGSIYYRIMVKLKRIIPPQHK